MVVRAVLFDYDGTLVDSVRGTFVVYNRIFSALGVGRMSYRFFRKNFSSDHDAFYGLVGIGKEQRAKMNDLWREHYWGAKELFKPYKGAFETVRKVADAGVAVGVVTDGGSWRVKDELERFGASRLFRLLVTHDEVNESKPSPKSILYAVGKLGLRGEECIYVGDRVQDIRAGKNAKTLTAAICGGMHYKSWLLKEKPDYLLENIEEVLELL